MTAHLGLQHTAANSLSVNATLAVVENTAAQVSLFVSCTLVVHTLVLPNTAVVLHPSTPLALP